MGVPRLARKHRSLRSSPWCLVLPIVVIIILRYLLVVQLPSFDTGITATVGPLFVWTDHHHVLQLNQTDYIMSHPGWDSSPIVVQTHKLIFFTVKKIGCTTWKRLFRRMLGYEDWQSLAISPHNPETNGLTYLKHFPLDQAEAMINDPSYTKAIFVRDPKERFLSAFLEKALKANGTRIVDICDSRQSRNRHPDRIWKTTRTFEGFVRLTRRECHDDHWKPQALRMDNIDPLSPLWHTINFVGHMERVEQDSKRLLQRIGAWEAYGLKGWDQNGTNSIFKSAESVLHQSGAATQLATYFTPQLAEEIDRRYAMDYGNPVLGLTPQPIDYDMSSQ